MADALILRRARTNDAEAIARIYADYVCDTVISFETEAPDAATMAERMAGGIGRDRPWIVAADGDGAVIGYAYAAPFHTRHAYRFTVEPTIYLARRAVGGGIGSRLYAALLTILEELGYRQAVALIALPNPASVALHLRHGFAHSGTHAQVGLKFGEWVDVGLFQRALGDGADTRPEQEPLPLDRSAGWIALG